MDEGGVGPATGAPVLGAISGGLVALAGGQPGTGGGVRSGG